MPGLVSDKFWAKLVVIAVFQYLGLEMASTCKLLHVLTIPPRVPLQLGESQIMSLKREKPKLMPGTRKHRYQSILVVLGRSVDGNGIQVYLMLPAQGGSLTGNPHKMLSDAWYNTYEIHVLCAADDAIKLNRDEAAAAMQLNWFVEERVQFSEERLPRLLQCVAHQRCSTMRSVSNRQWTAASGRFAISQTRSAFDILS